MINKLVESGIIGKISKEEMCLDLYVYEEMKKLGYDIYAFDVVRRQSTSYCKR